MACSGMLPSAPGSKPALQAQFLTSSVLACHCEPVISARGCCVRASGMASAAGRPDKVTEPLPLQEHIHGAEISAAPPAVAARDIAAVAARLLLDTRWTGLTR